MVKLEQMTFSDIELLLKLHIGLIILVIRLGPFHPHTLGL